MLGACGAIVPRARATCISLFAAPFVTCRRATPCFYQSILDRVAFYLGQVQVQVQRRLTNIEWRRACAFAYRDLHTGILG